MQSSVALTGVYYRLLRMAEAVPIIIQYLTLFLVYAVQALAWYFIRGFWPQSSPFILVIPVY